MGVEDEVAQQEKGAGDDLGRIGGVGGRPNAQGGQLEREEDDDVD